MPTNTTEQIQLSLVLDGTEVACQIIDLEYTAPGTTTGESVEVACPDGVVVEPGDLEDGQLTGTVFTDTKDTGISWLLMQARETGATIAYTLTWFYDQTADIAFEILKVRQSHIWPLARHTREQRLPINLTVLVTRIDQ